MTLEDVRIIDGHAVDLQICEREPVHAPGAIQPHGALLALGRADLRVTQVSENVDALLGMAPDEVLAAGLEAVLDDASVTAVRRALAEDDPSDANPLRLRARGGTQELTGLVHAHGGTPILELEPVVAPPQSRFYTETRRALARLARAGDLDGLTRAVVREIRDITGFDRVLVYRFAGDGHGEVVAEEVVEGAERWLGFHFPESDIPRQARELYARQWLRIVPDVDYEPVPVRPAEDPETGLPLDLSQCVLRSQSPMHREYLRNIGAAASMSVSLMAAADLWGLVICHHGEPRHVPFEERAACEFVAQAASLQIVAQRDARRAERHAEVADVQRRLLDLMSRHDPFQLGLVRHRPNLLDLVPAAGAAVVVDGTATTLGDVPDTSGLMRLVRWLTERPEEDAFVTDSLGRVDGLADLADRACGVLAVPLVRGQGAYVLWFRPEVVRTIDWGGDPNEPVRVGPAGRPHPRTSFARWRQVVEGHALAWEAADVEAAAELRRCIREIVMRRTEELAELNTELTRSNDELDAFAYVASHDLKEPLRGLHNYTHYLLEDYGDVLGAEAHDRLERMVRQTQRMGELIDSLLRYSRLGRVPLKTERVALDEVVAGALDGLRDRIEQAGAVVEVNGPLPVVEGDRARLREVFDNLVSNALKYTERPAPRIEIGVEERAAGEFGRAGGGLAMVRALFVADDGIGIRERHLDEIFATFVRLHPRDRYGGGTGAGLTIAKRIVERHGGEIWAESTYGEGSTFYFTLGEAAR